MRRSRAPRRPLLLLLFLGMPGGLAAQDAFPIPVGTRVRVSYGDSVRVGAFAAMTDRQIFISTGAATMEIPLVDVRRLEMSLGRRPSLWGAVGGLGVGGALGFLAGCDANRDDYGVFCGGQSDRTVALGAALGGVAGAALGAFVFGGVRWAQVLLSAPPPY